MKIEYPIRLQSYLAKSGFGSRRSCEELITAGRVRINTKRVTLLGTKVEENDIVQVDDAPAEPIDRTLYYVLNKPIGYVCTNFDPNETRYARDLIAIADKNLLFNVGRLDKDSSGLIIFTNDGDLAHKVTHPKNQIEKEYLVNLNRNVERTDLEKCLRGEIKPYKIKNFAFQSKRWVKVVLTEGKNREIRHMFEAMDYKVLSLTRLRIGEIKLGNLAPGKFRSMTRQEIRNLGGNV